MGESLEVLGPLPILILAKKGGGQLLSPELIAPSATVLQDLSHGPELPSAEVTITRCVMKTLPQAHTSPNHEPCMAQISRTT